LLEGEEALRALKGIGEEMAHRIAEISRTGGSVHSEELERRALPALADLLKIAEAEM
jgi:DNA polymerase/3'-5' exonuclease PolX